MTVALCCAAALRHAKPYSTTFTGALRRLAAVLADTVASRGRAHQ